MKLSKLVLTLVLFVVFQLMLMSQTRNPGVVSGRILDIHSKTPVEYANILLFDTLTGKMVTGIVSDSNGHFRLDNVPLGVFIVEYSFIGYATNRTSPVVVSRKAPGVDLGELLLDPSAFTMNEVTVTAEKATMITNPSAKYKPDGTGGIINIILKKERKRGFNGILGANVGNHSRFNTNLQLNYNPGKVNLFGSYGYRQDYRRRTRELFSQTIDTSTSQSTCLEQNGEGISWTDSHLAQLGFDWIIGKKDATGIAGTYNYRKSNRGDSTWNQYRDNNQVLTEEFSRILDGKETETSIGLTTYYEHAFNRDEEHLLRFDFEYQRDEERENDMWTTHYDFPAYPQGQDHNMGLNIDEELDLNLGYSRPLWEDAALELGYEGTMQINDIDQTVESFDSTSMQWIPDPQEGSSFRGNQTVHALYVTLAWEWKKFSLLHSTRPFTWG